MIYSIILIKISIIYKRIYESMFQITINELWNKDKDETSKSRYSNSFAKSVIQGAESGEISYTYAFNLFDGSAILKRRL
jgi:hypothetical protein